MKTASFIFFALLLLLNSAFADWSYVPKIDDFEDTDSSYIYVDGVPGRGLSQYDEPYLMLRCNSNEPSGLSLLAGMDTYLNNDDPIQVRWRFDKDEPSQYHWWDISTSGTAAFARNVETRALIAGFKAKNEFLFEATSYNKERHSAVFSLKGFTAAFNQFKCPIDEEAIR